MNLIKPFTKEIKLNLENSVTILKHIETCGRICYKSEDKITDDSYISFVKMLISKGHFAMLEHNLIPIELSGERSFELYSLLKDYQYINEDSFESYTTSYVNYTKTNNRIIISANLRVYRDLFKYFKDSVWVHHLIHFLVSKGFGIIFEDLIDEESNFTYLNYPHLKSLPELRLVTNVEDLTIGERLFHEFKSVLFVCDRGVSHELVRHRVANFAQESTRYCNYGKESHMNFIIPSWLNMKEGICDYYTYPDRENLELIIWLEAMDIAEHKYNVLIKKGWKPQEARSILPNSLKTEIIVSMNMRGWKHFFDMRLPLSAHPQMRELTIPLYEEKFKHFFEKA